MALVQFGVTRCINRMDLNGGEECTRSENHAKRICKGTSVVLRSGLPLADAHPATTEEAESDPETELYSVTGLKQLILNLHAGR